MCVIVHQPIGQSIDKATATKLWDRNPDGGGFAYVDDNQRLQVYKTMQFGDFWRSFERARSDFPRRDFLLHMRIATHGSVSIDNVHPFVVDEHTVMAHNGIIHPVTERIPKGDDRSDTRFFIDEVLPKLPETWLDDDDLRDMVDAYIGWSKLMFITTNPVLEHQVYRLGEWKDHEGLPMSNTNGLIPEKKSWEFSGYRSTPTKTEKTYPSKEFSPNTYQLPLPRDTGRRDATEDWMDWLEYKENEFLGGFDYNVNAHPLDDTEFQILLDAVKAERASMMLVHPIVVIDQHIGQLECAVCLEQIDLDTAECGCWDQVCQGCWQFLALCRGEGPCEAADRHVIDFEALTEKGKEFVNEGGLTKYSPDERKIVEKHLSQTGAGNTKSD